MDKDIVKISKELVDKVQSIDEYIDQYFDPITDVVDTAKDLFSPIKLVHSLYTLNKKRKFKKFLKFYAKSFGNYNFEKNSETLKNYLADQKNFNFINDTIEGAISARSIFGAMLLGYYAGQILQETEIINYKHLIIVDAIKNLNDYEIAYFTRIYAVADLAKVVNIYELKDKLGLPTLYEITIKKLLQLRIVDEPPIIASDNQNGRFLSNEIGEDIYLMIKDSGIENELLKYY